jgi:hypothetical protein
LLLTLLVTTPLGLACERPPAPATGGAPYGVGLPRQAITLGHTRHARGETGLGFSDPAHPPEWTPWGWGPGDAGPLAPPVAVPAIHARR